MKRNGFTLIELLVVISIIAVLMSIMMPALSKVRQQSQATVCMTNVRTITTACMTYTADFNGRYPLGGSRDSAGVLSAWGGNYPGAPYWDARLMPYISSGYNVDPKINSGANLSPLLSVNSDIFDVLLCPAAKADPYQNTNIKMIETGTSTRSANKFPRSYRLNAMLTGYSKLNGPYSNFATQAYKESVKVSQVNNSAATLLAVESSVGDGSCFNTIYGWAARSWADVQPAHFIKRNGVAISNYTWDGIGSDSNERQGQSNMGFADGHIEKVKREYDNKYWKTGGEEGTAGRKFYAVGRGTAKKD